MIISRCKTRKTVCHLFTSSTRTPQIRAYYNNQTLNQVDTFCYLGVFLDNKLLWRRLAEETVEKGTEFLKLLSLILWGSSTDTLLTTYKIYVKPVLHYGGEVLLLLQTFSQQ